MSGEDGELHGWNCSLRSNCLAPICADGTDQRQSNRGSTRIGADQKGRRLIWAGVGVEGEVEEFVLEVFFGGAIGDGRTAGGGGDDGEQVDVGEGGAGDVEALSVGAGVGRGEEEAGVVDEGVEQGAIGGGEAFEEVAGTDGEAEPEALAALTGEEGAAGEALGVDWVREVEVADVADELDVV